MVGESFGVVICFMSTFELWFWAVVTCVFRF